MLQVKIGMSYEEGSSVPSQLYQRLGMDERKERKRMNRERFPPLVNCLKPRGVVAVPSYLLVHHHQQQHLVKVFVNFVLDFLPFVTKAEEVRKRGRTYFAKRSRKT